MSDRQKGIMYVLVAAAISGFSVFYNKSALDKGINPLALNIIKNGGAALLLTFVILSSNQTIRLSQKPLSYWLKLVILGVLGGSLPFILFFTGLSTIPAVNANLIHKTMFLWTALLAIPLLGENINILQMIGYIFVFISNFLIGGFAGFTGNRGELLVLAATLIWTLENILAKKILTDIDAGAAAWGRMFFGTVILLVYALWKNSLDVLLVISPTQYLPLSVSVIVLSAYILCWYKALKIIQASLASSFLVLATPITNILTVVFITGSSFYLPYTNFFLTVLGIVIITLAKSKPQSAVVLKT